MNTSSIARLFVGVLAVGFVVLLLSGLTGRGEDSLRSVIQQAQSDTARQLVALSRAGLPQ